MSKESEEKINIIYSWTHCAVENGGYMCTYNLLVFNYSVVRRFPEVDGHLGSSVKE